MTPRIRFLLESSARDAYESVANIFCALNHLTAAAAVFLFDRAAIHSARAEVEVVEVYEVHD